MTSPLILLGWFALVLLASVAVSYALTALKLRSAGNFDLEPNAPVRLRGTSGMLRCRFVRSDALGWWFTCPISRDHYVPLRVGEHLFVEAPVTGKGAFVFETEVAARDGLAHEICLRRPSVRKVFERRIDPRDSGLRGEACEVNGEQGEILDMSPNGVRVVCLSGAMRGDEVRLRLPGKGLVFGWVLESTPEAFGDRQGACLRIRIAG